MPGILELLSELEDRDKDAKGKAQSGAVAGAGLDDLRDCFVLNAGGHTVGKVTDLYVDPHSRIPKYALLTLGHHLLGIGNRRVLVAFADVERAGDGQVKVRVALPEHPPAAVG